MIGYCGVFFLLGIFLANTVAGRSSGISGLKSVLEAVDSDEVEAQLMVKKRQYFLDGCQDLLGDDLEIVESCAALVKDLVKLDVVVANLSAQAAIIYTAGVKLVLNFNTCGTKLIISEEIKCLEKVYSSAKTLVARAKEEFVEFETQIVALVDQITSDYQTCYSAGFSNKRLEAMSLCKSRLA